MSFTLDQSQIEAVERAVERPFSIINGGAGCGKTTIIREIVNRLEQEGEIVKLCSPTGKAAARLRQASGCPACTVRRSGATAAGRRRAAISRRDPVLSGNRADADHLLPERRSGISSRLRDPGRADAGAARRIRTRKMGRSCDRRAGGNPAGNPRMGQAGRFRFQAGYHSGAEKRRAQRRNRRVSALHREPAQS